MDSQPTADRARPAAWIALAVLAAVAAFFPAMRDGYVLDDVAQARDLPTPRGFADWIGSATEPWWPAEKGKSLWRPVTRLAIRAEKGIGAALGWEGPAPMRAASLALHAIGCVLALLLARELRLGWPGAGAAAILWAVHPLQSEAVHQIVGQAELLAGIFMLGGLAAHARLRRRGAGVAAMVATQAAAYALAIGAKEHAAIYPIYLALLEFDLRREEKRDTRSLLAIFGALGSVFALFLALKLWIVGALAEPASNIPAYENALAAMPFARRLVGALGIFGYALAKLVVPSALAPDYSAESLPLGDAAWPMAWLGAAAAVAIALHAAWSMRRGGRGWALAVAGSAAYGFTSNIILVIGVSLALRLWHFPMLAPLVAAGWLWERWDRRGRGAASTLAAAAPRLALGVAAILLMSATWGFAPAWRSPEEFALRTLDRFPRSWRAHHNLATEYYERKAFETALERARAAAAIRPDSALTQDTLGLAAMFIPGREGEAEAAFRRAIELRPDLALPHNHLGNLLLMRGRGKEAVPHFERYLATRPPDAAKVRKKIEEIRAGGG